FRIKSTNPIDELLTLESARAELAAEIEDNTLVVSAKPCSKEKVNAMAYTKGISYEIEPAYFNSVKAVYLVDLRKTLPDSVVVCDRSVITNLKAMVPSGMEYKYYSDLMDIRFPERSLYDTLYFSVQHYIRSDNQEIFSLGPELPFSGGVSVTLKPAIPYSMDKKTAVYRVNGNSLSYEGGVWANGKLTFAPRELGDFTILSDTIPPSITRIYANNQAVRFKISDRLSGISTFEATINGKWLLLDYDAKSHAIVSRRLNPDELIRGDFELTVTDQAGNKKTYTQKII
ncbi:MAG: M23 family peptidase, partial [Cyclobacteriaceae bacterium]|nr:M23 family peptidase [Cyclobacteriaceae bacterium]